MLNALPSGQVQGSLSRAAAMPAVPAPRKAHGTSFLGDIFFKGFHRWGDLTVMILFSLEMSTPLSVAIRLQASLLSGFILFGDEMKMLDYVRLLHLRC